MKNLLLILMFLTISGSSIAKDKTAKDPFIGTWKFSNHSAVNDFQKAFAGAKQKNYQSEYFTFEANHSFIHNFIDKDGNLVKTLSGKWKSAGDKINIKYSDVDFNLTISYFFLDKDLVLGQNFSHVIFTKDDNIDLQNLAMKLASK